MGPSGTLKGWAGKVSVKMGDFSGGPVVKKSPSNAKDVGSIPGRGTKIPHALGQLGSCATIRKSVNHNKDLMCHN